MSSKKGCSPESSKYNRRFSEALKRQLVGYINNKEHSMASICHQYQVSRTSLYKWIYLYSDRVKGTRTVVELESQDFLRERLLGRIAELERIVGQKQLEIDILHTTLNQVAEELGLDDLKKKYAVPSLKSSKSSAP